jgi:hypothetical protein
MIKRLVSSLMRECRIILVILKLSITISPTLMKVNPIIVGVLRAGKQIWKMFRLFPI